MKYLASTTFAWKIDNFSELTTEDLYSDMFMAERCIWRLRMTPKGDSVDALSIYLDVADSISLPNGWSRMAYFSVSLIDQLKKRSAHTQDRQHVFCEKETYSGIESFVYLSNIKRPEAGYLVKDTLRVEVEIEVRRVVHYSVIEPAKKVNQDEPKQPKRAFAPLDLDPMSCHVQKYQKCISQEKDLLQKEVLETKATVEPPTAIVTTLTAKPLSQAEGVVQTRATTNEQEFAKELFQPPAIVNEQDLPQDPPTEPVLSSPDVQKICKNLRTEILSRTKTQKSFPSNEIPIPSEATRPDFVRQQKEALDGFLNMSLEDIQQADAFGKMEKIILALVQHTNSLQEKTILEDLASRLAEFQESVPKSTIIAETVQARKISFARKTVDLNVRLEQRQKELTALEEKFSRLLEEESKLRAEIQCLTTQKEELLSQKQSAAIELQKANEGASRELEELRDLEGEIKQSNAERLRAKENLALANVRWKHYREDYAETEKSSSPMPNGSLANVR